MTPKQQQKVIEIIRAELSNDFQTNIDVEIVHVDNPLSIDDYSIKIHAHENLSDNEVSTMEQYYTHLLRLNYRLEGHDWYYPYSDDNGRYTSGRENLQQIQKYRKILGHETYTRVYNSVAPDNFKI